MDKENIKKIFKQVLELLYEMQEELEKPEEPEEPKLRDCPFCGGIASLYESINGWVVDCTACGTATLAQDAKQEVIDLWNGELE
jgi:hypothetical protein